MNAAETMRTIFEAVDAHDTAGLVKFDDDATYADFVVLGPVVGRDAIGAFFDELFAAMPDLRFEVVRIFPVDDDTAIGQWEIRGTFDGGPFQGIAPTGKRVHIRGADIMEFAGGVLKRNTVYYDGLAFARQIGLLPAEDSGADRALMAGFNALTAVKDRIRSARS